MFERPRSGERAVLVRLGLGAQVDPEDLQEFTQLALSAGAQPVATITGRRERPDHTLQPTALINEAYLRLIKQDFPEWQSRRAPPRCSFERRRGTHCDTGAQIQRRVLQSRARSR